MASNEMTKAGIAIGTLRNKYQLIGRYWGMRMKDILNDKDPSPTYVGSNSAAYDRT